MVNMRNQRRYFIRETWRMHFMGAIATERYNERTMPSNTVSSLKDLKTWIVDWIESWEYNAKDNGYTFLDSKTDYKTFARCRIKSDAGVDIFSLKVIKGSKTKGRIKRR